VLAAGVVLAVAVSRGGESEGQQLRALREDPLGRYVPRDGRLVRTYANDKKSGGMFSKPSPARFQRLFALPPDGGPAAMQEAIDAATAAGWTMQPPVGDLGSVGDKQLSTGKATVAFTLITDPQALPEGTQAPVLTIGLEHVQ
jgi:hypothetical protein